MIYGNSRKLITLSVTKQRIFDFVSSNRIKSVLLIDEAVRTTRNCQMGWWGYVQRVIWVFFLSGSLCTDIKGCGRKWVIWVLKGTGTAIWRPGVSWKISQPMCWLSQRVICSKIEQPECWKRTDDGEYNISIDTERVRLLWLLQPPLWMN